MTNYRRKSAIKAWRNLPSNDVPRWVLALPGISLGNGGQLRFSDGSFDVDDDLVVINVPDDAWVVLEGDTASVLPPAQFADQFEEDKPAPSISVKDLPDFPNRPYRRYADGGIGAPLDAGVIQNER